MSTQVVAERLVANRSAEERWDAWLERGVEQDRLRKKYAVVVIVAIVAVVALAIFLIR